MKESNCNTELVRSLLYYKWEAYKLPDVMGSRFTANKPCDVIAGSPKGRYVAIESKLSKKWEGFSIGRLAPHQVLKLDDTITKINGRSFVFLFFRIKADKSKGQKRVIKLCVLDWKTHKKHITKGIGVAQLREQSIGKWYDPINVIIDKDKPDLVWPIKDLLKIQ